MLRACLAWRPPQCPAEDLPGAAVPGHSFLHAPAQLRAWSPPGTSKRQHPTATSWTARQGHEGDRTCRCEDVFLLSSASRSRQGWRLKGNHAPLRDSEVLRTHSRWQSPVRRRSPWFLSVAT